MRAGRAGRSAYQKGCGAAGLRGGAGTGGEERAGCSREPAAALLCGGRLSPPRAPRSPAHNSGVRNPAPFPPARTPHPPAAAEPPASPAVPGGRALFAAAAGPWEPPGAPDRAR